MSCEPSQAGRGAKPGATARPRGYLFIPRQLRAQAPRAGLLPDLGARGCGDFTLPPGCSLAVSIPFIALWLQRDCGLWSAAIVPDHFCQVGEGSQNHFRMLRFSFFVAPRESTEAGGPASGFAFYSILSKERAASRPSALSLVCFSPQLIPKQPCDMERVGRADTFQSI